MRDATVGARNVLRQHEALYQCADAGAPDARRGTGTTRVYEKKQRMPLPLLLVRCWGKQADGSIIQREVRRW